MVHVAYPASGWEDLRMPLRARFDKRWPGTDCHSWMLLGRHPSCPRPQRRSCSVPSPDPWHETIPHSCRIVAVAGIVGSGPGAVVCRSHLVQEIESREPS